ncbi:lytic transglycosylase, partial [Paraburkholderia sp. BR10879]
MRAWVAIMSLAALGATLAHAAPPADECFEKAGAYQGVNPLVLRAVA